MGRTKENEKEDFIYCLDSQAGYEQSDAFFVEMGRADLAIGARMIPNIKFTKKVDGELK